MRRGNPKHGTRIVALVNALPSLLDRLDTAECLLGEASEAALFASAALDARGADDDGLVDLSATIRTFLAAKE